MGTKGPCHEPSELSETGGLSNHDLFDLEPLKHPNEDLSTCISDTLQDNVTNGTLLEEDKNEHNSAQEATISLEDFSVHSESLSAGFVSKHQLDIQPSSNNETKESIFETELSKQHSSSGKNNPSTTEKEIARDTSNTENSNQTPSIPTPLSLPKRFPVPSSKNPVKTTSEFVKKENGNGVDKEKEIKPRQSSPGITNKPNDQNYQPLQQLQQMPGYQQMFYNPATGQVMSLPVQVQTPLVSYPYPMIPQPYTLPPSQPMYTIPPTTENYLRRQQQQPQMGYVRNSNGQLVLVPLCNPLPTTTTVSTSNKRQKKSRTTGAMTPEQLQKKHIEHQMKIHPNLQNELQSPKILDVYETKETPDVPLSNSPVHSQGHRKDGSDDGSELLGMPSTVFDTASNLASAAAPGIAPETLNIGEFGNNTLAAGAKSHVSKPNGGSPKAERIVGSLTLNGFTYKYSQTLSGDLSKDRDLFDRLTESAWKACISKR